MQKLMSKLFLFFLIVSMSGCATIEDVQRGNDLIRTDNELARILDNNRIESKIDYHDELVQIGNHAKKEGDALRKKQNKALDAIAYYRIAATAYWKSEYPDVTNDLFSTINSGIEICNKKGDKAPDRDCLYMQLVIPLAAMESFTGENQISAMLNEVVFSDGTATADEIEIMNKVAALLQQLKTQVESVLVMGKKERLLSHSGMKAYYCDQAENVNDFYDKRASNYITKASLFEEKFPNHTPHLKMTLEQALKLKKLENVLPESCRP